MPMGMDYIHTTSRLGVVCHHTSVGFLLHILTLR